jgi:heme/copper-type cytochrome/quinol oxidase subunit 1
MLIVAVSTPTHCTGLAGATRRLMQHEPYGKYWDKAAMASFFSKLKTE